MARVFPVLRSPEPVEGAQEEARALASNRDWPGAVARPGAGAFAGLAIDGDSQSAFVRVIKKVLLTLLALTVILAATVYLAGGWLVGRATGRFLPLATREIERVGIKVGRLEFAAAGIAPPARVYWRDWTVEATPPPTRRRPAPDSVRLRARSLRLEVSSWSPLTATLRLEGVAVDSAIDPATPEDVPFSSAEFSVSVEKIDGGFVAVPGIPLRTDAAAFARTMATELQTLFRTGRCSRDVQCGARLHFRLKDRAFSVRLETLRVDGATVLRLNRDDIDAFSRGFERPITAAEQEILHEFPLRAPLLLRVMGYAERTARRLSTLERAYGEDFTRHILWSYWLARLFGPDFAERVTDAHETGSTGNTQAERQQDLANNALGRSYAAAKKSEGQVLHLIKTDPLVVRTAR